MPLCKGFAVVKGRAHRHAQRCGATPEFEGMCVVHLKAAGYSRCATCATWRTPGASSAAAQCQAPAETTWRPMACAPRTGRQIVIEVAGGLERLAHWCAFVEDHPPIDPAFYFHDGVMNTPVRDALRWREPPREAGEYFSQHKPRPDLEELAAQPMRFDPPLDSRALGDEELRRDERNLVTGAVPACPWCEVATFVQLRKPAAGVWHCEACDREFQIPF